MHCAPLVPLACLPVCVSDDAQVNFAGFTGEVPADWANAHTPDKLIVNRSSGFRGDSRWVGLALWRYSPAEARGTAAGAIPGGGVRAWMPTWAAWAAWAVWAVWVV